MARVIQADEVINAEEGDLRVWWSRNRNPMEFHIVGSPEEAVKVLENLAQADLADESVITNTGGLEMYEDGDWSEWYDTEGDDIDAFAEAQ